MGLIDMALGLTTVAYIGVLTVCVDCYPRIQHCQNWGLRSTIDAWDDSITHCEIPVSRPWKNVVAPDVMDCRGRLHITRKKL